AAQFRFVDDIVMQQGGCMNELDQGGQQVVRLAFVAASPRDHEHQCRAQALAAGANDVFAEGLDEHDVRVQTRAYQGVYGSHFGLDRGQDRLNVHEWRGEKTGAKLGMRGCPVKGVMTVDRKMKRPYYTLSLSGSAHNTNYV